MLSRREHAEARPLRLDNALVFHSVSATNCLQKYTFFQIRNKKEEKSAFFNLFCPVQKKPQSTAC